MSNQLPQLIAHYLASNYPTVLDPFLRAASVAPPDLAHPLQPDLRTLVEDWVSAQLVKDLDDVAIDEEPRTDGSWKGWKLKDMVKIPLKDEVILGGVKRSLEGISAANLLTVGVANLPKREFDTSSAVYRASYHRNIITTSVDKSLKVIDYDTGQVERILQPHRAAILSFAVHPINPRYIVTGSMDGQTILTDLITSETLQTFSSSKFVVRVAFSPDGRYLATASYDHFVVIYAATTAALPPPLTDDDIPLDDEDDPALACEPGLRYTEVKRIKVDSNPEAILFASDWLMYTTRSSHLLSYVRLPSPNSGGGAVAGEEKDWESRTKSFNPHPMDNHISFSILNLALHPSGRIIACQTGDHRSSGERILLYGVEPEETERLGCLWTGNEGDDFVLPRMAWLPDGSGLITTTPNGYLNLIAVTGETRSSVKVHGALDLGQASSEVVRDCCVVSEGNQWEVVSVGYDRQVRISR